MVRNKANDFSGKIDFHNPRAKAAFASKKTNGATRDHAQERMGRSNMRDH